MKNGNFGLYEIGLQICQAPSMDKEESHCSFTDKARNLRYNNTDAECIIWNMLRQKKLNGRKFRRQEPIGRYIVDFVCYQARLIIELDGGHHSERSVYDKARTRWLKSQGFDVLRFWNNEIFDNIDGVIGVIEEKLNEEF